MAGVNISYKGSTIAEMSDSGSKTLKTSGTYCEGDISVQYEKPTAGDVTSGTKAIISNGTHDVTGYASADVSILPNVKYIECELTSDVSGGWVEFNPDGDADIKAHRTDSTMRVLWFRTTACEQTTYHQASQCGNIPVNSYYGSCLVKTSSGASATFINTALTADASTVAKKTIINTDGVVRAYASSQYPIRAGSYVCIVTW